MTPEEADKSQEWLKLTPAVAWHLIERHADGWQDVDALMAAYVRAYVIAEREACAKVCEEMHEQGDVRNPISRDAFWCAQNIRRRSNAQGNAPETAQKG